MHSNDREILGLIFLLGFMMSKQLESTTIQLFFETGSNFRVKSKGKLEVWAKTLVLNKNQLLWIVHNDNTIKQIDSKYIPIKFEILKSIL